MAICQRCGQRDNEGRFCVNCGAPIEPTPAPAVPAYPAQVPAPGFHQPQFPAPGYQPQARPQPSTRIWRTLLVVLAALLLLGGVGGVGLQWYMGRPAKALADRFLGEVQQGRDTCGLVSRYICEDVLPKFQQQNGQLQSFQYAGTSWEDPLHYAVAYDFTGTKRSGRLLIRLANDGRPRIYAFELGR